MRYLILCLLVPLSLFAQDSPQYRACTNKAQAQMQLNQCAGEEAVRVDAELNVIYRKLLDAAASDTGAIGKIKAMQRTWLSYRDAYIEAMYPAKDKQAEYGSIYPMDVALLNAKLTRRQINALKELLHAYQSD